MPKDPILLFYDGTERPAWDGSLGALMSQGRRGLRFAYRTLRRKQVRTGFYTAFLALEGSLRKAGAEVRVNDFATARRRPELPIGVAGYVSVLGRTAPLANRRVFGPGDFGGPPESAEVARDDRYVVLTQPCAWFADLYRPYVGDKIASWFVGIDTERLRPDPAVEKDLDVLIYDKIRWDREIHEPGILARTTALLKSRGLSFASVRYGHHHHSEFYGLAHRAKAMIFLCEHETQGLAYQEAMAMGVPVLAWDEGALIDPYLKTFWTPEVKVTSVPYFDERCGARFTEANLETVFPDFWERLPTLQPRAYVEERLSMAESARRYLQHYDAAR